MAHDALSPLLLPSGVGTKPPLATGDPLPLGGKTIFPLRQGRVPGFLRPAGSWIMTQRLSHRRERSCVQPVVQPLETTRALC